MCEKVKGEGDRQTRAMENIDSLCRTSHVLLTTNTLVVMLAGV